MTDEYQEYLFVERFLKSESKTRPETEWTDQMKAFLIEKIKNRKAGNNLDYVDLSDSDLTGMYLSGFSFAHANLVNTNRANANLANANLEGSTLELRAIRDANLSKANLKAVKFVNTELKMTSNSNFRIAYWTIKITY